MLHTPKGKGELFLASSLCDGLEDNDMKHVTTLLEYKVADPNVLIPAHGITPFHLVIGNESELFAEKVTKLFLRHGGNPNVKSADGMTPVHVAAAWGRVKILELLLANGGDPLCIDDDGRTPFHYAFDGAYYDAITVLGKYCTKNVDLDDDNYDDDTDEEKADKYTETKPQIHIKLEKILVNRGNVIAEYVPSEIDLTNDTQNETKGNNNRTNLKYIERNSSPNEDLVNLDSNNITYRRGRQYNNQKKEISPILAIDSFDINSKGRNIAEEKILVGKIIKRLSDSFVTTDKKSENYEKEIGNEKKLNSLIPQPKYFENNLKSQEKSDINSKLNTSIISKSPNCKIPMKAKVISTTSTLKYKNKPTNFVKKNLNSNNTNRPLNAITSSTINAPKINSTNSTPIKQSNRHKFELENLSANKNIKRDFSNNKLKRNYIDTQYDMTVSPKCETNMKNIDKKKMYKNIARKLDVNMNDENCGTNSISCNKQIDAKKQLKLESKSPSVCSKFTKFFQTKYSPEIIRGINKVKSVVQDIRIQKQKNDDRELKKVESKISSKCKNIKQFFESPGSSHPISTNYQSVKNETNSNIGQEFWDELDEIYKNKGPTPPASITKFINDSLTSLNDSQSCVSQKMDDTDNSNNNSIDEVNNENCNDAELYKTPVASTFSVGTNFESFISVDEEYAYVDKEKDVAFTERRLRVIPKIENMNRVMDESSWNNKNAELSNAFSQVSLRTSDEFEKIHNHGGFFMSNASLRHQLIALGEIPGPITNTTHYLYLRRLYKLKRKKSGNLNQCIIESPLKNEKMLKSPAISPMLLTPDWITNQKYYRDLEELAFREYEKPNDHKKYRGGLAKTSFNYLLLDPRITKDLPRNGRDLTLHERWKIFLSAIFYVGKGKNSRPFAHLYESHEIWTGKKQNDESSDKIQRILDIWREDKGVVCHQIFTNSMQEEAFTRESAMIDALGTKHLSNCNRGKYYGLAATMNKGEKKALGKYLLYKAMEILMHDGERQQFPRNIE